MNLFTIAAVVFVVGAGVAILRSIAHAELDEGRRFFAPLWNICATTILWVIGGVIVPRSFGPTAGAIILLTVGLLQIGIALHRGCTPQHTSNN